MQHGCKRLAAAGACVSLSFPASAWPGCCKISCPRRSVLADAAKKAHGMATVDAVKRLADLVDELVKSKE
jgi:hypothetical protein